MASARRPSPTSRASEVAHVARELQAGVRAHPEVRRDLPGALRPTTRGVVRSFSTYVLLFDTGTFPRFFSDRRFRTFRLSAEIEAFLDSPARDVCIFFRFYMLQA